MFSFSPIEEILGKQEYFLTDENILFKLSQREQTHATCQINNISLVSISGFSHHSKCSDPNFSRLIFDFKQISLFLLTIPNEQSLDFDEIVRLTVGIPLCLIWFSLGLYTVLIDENLHSSHFYAFSNGFRSRKVLFIG